MTRDNSLCIICKEKPPRDLFWLYMWNEKSGFACEECGERFYKIGDYLNNSAARYFKDSLNIEIEDVKDKFGMWIIYIGNVVPAQVKGIKELHKKYKKLFPEFTFDWDYAND